MAVGGCRGEQAGLVAAQVPGRPRAGAAARHARRGHGVHRAHGRGPHRAGPDNRRGAGALPPGLRHPGPPARCAQPPGVGHGYRPAGLPVGHLRRDHPGPVAPDSADLRRAGGGADRHGGVRLHERRLPGLATARRRDPAGPAAVPGQYDLGEREWRQPDPPVPDLRLRHAGPGAHRLLDRRDHRDPAGRLEGLHLPGPRAARRPVQPGHADDGLVLVQGQRPR